VFTDWVRTAVFSRRLQPLSKERNPIETLALVSAMRSSETHRELTRS